jgi:hypothetical protein
MESFYQEDVRKHMNNFSLGQEGIHETKKQKEVCSCWRGLDVGKEHSA